MARGIKRRIFVNKNIKLLAYTKPKNFIMGIFFFGAIMMNVVECLSQESVSECFDIKQQLFCTPARRMTMLSSTASHDAIEIGERDEPVNPRYFIPRFKAMPNQYFVTFACHVDLSISCNACRTNNEVVVMVSPNSTAHNITTEFKCVALAPNACCTMAATQPVLFPQHSNSSTRYNYKQMLLRSRMARGIGERKIRGLRIKSNIFSAQQVWSIPSQQLNHCLERVVRIFFQPTTISTKGALFPWFVRHMNRVRMREWFTYVKQLNEGHTCKGGCEQLLKKEGKLCNKT